MEGIQYFGVILTAVGVILIRVEDLYYSVGYSEYCGGYDDVYGKDINVNNCFS